MNKPLSELNLIEWMEFLSILACLVCSALTFGKDDIKAIWFILMAIFLFLVIK